MADEVPGRVVEIIVGKARFLPDPAGSRQ